MNNFFQVNLPFAPDSVDTNGSSIGTLDFWSAPVVTIKVKNANTLLHEKDLVVTYNMPSNMMLAKPIFLSLVIFGMLLIMITLSRVDLSLVDESKVKKE